MPRGILPRPIWSPPGQSIPARLVWNPFPFGPDDRCLGHNQMAAVLFRLSMQCMHLRIWGLVFKPKILKSMLFNSTTCDTGVLADTAVGHEGEEGQKVN